MHDLEISLADTNNDDGHRQSVALYEKIEYFLLVMDLTISQYEEDHVVST